MRDLAYPLAVLIVAALGVAAVGLAAAARTWVSWVLRIGGTGGLIGLALTAATAVNLFVPRTCAEAETAMGTYREANRPAFSVVVDDGACFRSGLAQVQILALAAVATSAVSLVGAPARGRQAATR